MKRKNPEKSETQLKMQLHRETIQALEPPDLAEIQAGATSRCHSGVTCCTPGCTG
jgi:hypothetical protein